MPICWRVACSYSEQVPPLKFNVASEVNWSHRLLGKGWKIKLLQTDGKEILYRCSTISVSTAVFKAPGCGPRAPRLATFFLEVHGETSKNTEALGFPNRPTTLSESVFPPWLSLPHRHGIRPDTSHARQAGQPAGRQAGHHHHLWHHTQGLSLSKKIAEEIFFPTLDAQVVSWIGSHELESGRFFPAKSGWICFKTSFATSL